MTHSRRHTDILNRLRQSGRATAAYFRSLKAEDWEAVIYSEGNRWRVREMMAHFSSIENTMQWLFENMLRGGTGSPGDFDLNRFNNSQAAKYAALPPEELIRRFEAVRAKTIEIVERMQDADLDRIGNHAFLGRGTLERFVRWAYEHNTIHEEEVRIALQAEKEANNE